ncbi:MAG: tannase/feruloyl esterase family alpha/beta hydrolase, partial [Solirubrobacterales bacterium]|nr:tannase/feruloyl esterase family alpha/beta hydrolase [Solirubrobacterales bacterium]
MIYPQFCDGPRRARRLIGLAALVCAFFWVAPASAAVITPVASCQSLATLDLSGNDAEVLTAQVTQLEQHSYCDVTGIISPQTHFDVVLPTATWQGDYLQQGCGGFCGLNAGSQSVNLVDPSRTSLNQASWAPLLNGELVVGADDQGHRAATNSDALW